MITVIGTGHVFGNLSEQIMFLVKQIWPQAVLVELDMARYRALEAGKEDADPEGEKELPKIYRRTARYQDRESRRRGTSTGSELLTAVQTGRLIGAEIGFIDDDAARVIGEAWEEMPFRERLRYRMSSVTDRFSGKDLERMVGEYSDREEETMADFRRKYPTLMRKLVDERNVFMAEQIKGYAERYDEIVVVVGDLHVEGISELLGDREIRKIRLRDMLNKDSLDKIKTEVWNR